MLSKKHISILSPNLFFSFLNFLFLCEVFFCLFIISAYHWSLCVCQRIAWKKKKKKNSPNHPNNDSATFISKKSLEIKEEKKSKRIIKTEPAYNDLMFFFYYNESYRKNFWYQKVLTASVITPMLWKTKIKINLSIS